MARLANAMLENSINALSRLDVEHAVEVVRNDQELDLEFQASLRRLVTFPMEDVRNFSHITNIVLVIKALERIDDHAKNIAEHVVFLVRGKDVRHYTLEALVTDVLGTQWADS
jgi:phosphate transport system protein